MAISLAEDADRVPKNFHTLFTILTTARDRAKEIRSPKDRLYFVEEVVLRLLSDYISDVCYFFPRYFVLFSDL
jgi:flagellar biosynthesis regulator FlaF